MNALHRSRALWNRTTADLRSFEVVAQVLDRGEPAAWRQVYALAKSDPELRRRILRVAQTVPMPYGHFWLAALARLGEPVDLGQQLPQGDQGT